MKLLHRKVERNGSGSVTLMPEESEDMWHIYNLITEGDHLTSTTIRKVAIESANGAIRSNRICTTLTIKVENTDFDIQAHTLRVKGRNIQENQYVKMGAYHTIDLELNRKFALSKEVWDTVALERITLACDPAQHADLAAVVMQEGIAHVCLITASMTIVRAKIDITVPRKKKGVCGQHNKGLEKFFEAVYQAVVKRVNFDIVKSVLIGSPGLIKDQFFEYMMRQASRTGNKAILGNKSHFVLVHSSSGFKHSLKEVLSDPKIANKLKNTKAAGEIKILDKFCSMLDNEQSKAFYGLKHVQRACEAQAIDTLLISDKLFRCNDVAERKMYVDLVDSVRYSGGKVKMFSSLHPSGEQLDDLTGIAAILRFPMEELEETNSED